MPVIKWCMFSCHYALSGKPDIPILLAKPDVLIYQTGVSSFGRHNICFSCFNCCEPLVICITYYLFTHTFVPPHECINIEGALLDFLEKCAK
jgi:hypothetical protein